MKLALVFQNVSTSTIPPEFRDMEVRDVQCDSRQVKPGDIFVAVKGAVTDGHQFIPDAIGRGAKVIVLAGKGRSSVPEKNVLVVEVEDPQAALRDILTALYGNPSDEVAVVGITGTNGKTTISYLLESIVRAAGKTCGVVGTVNRRVGETISPSPTTTPGIVENQRFLRELADKKIPYCFVEVSSHALEQGRTDLIDFRTAVFTNLTGDHLDYHGDMAGYFKAKSRLFTGLKEGSFAVINTDDEYGRQIPKVTPARTVLYGLGPGAEISASMPDLDLSGTRFTLRSPQGVLEIRTSLIGRYNVYNILAAAATAFSLGFDPEIVRRGIETFTAVPGRLEKIDEGQEFSVFVDYAHTDDALNNVLSALREVARKKVIVVFGCGGDRDKSKRPRMGTVADRWADRVILTSDNPRSEDPGTIASEIAVGIKGNSHSTILGRRDAIAAAIAEADAGDVILIAGKGHEDYQVFADRTIHFDDREVARECLIEGRK